MDHPTLPKSTKDKTRSPLVIFLCLLPLFSPIKGTSPHLPKQLTWQVLSQTGEVVWSITGLHTPGAWWPTLTPDFCQLAAGLDEWDIPTADPHSLAPMTGTRIQQMTAPGCSSPTARCRLAQSDFYVCPKDGRDRATAYRCGGYQEYFCSQWGCETTGDAYWKPSSGWDSITVRRNYTKPDPDGNTCYHSRGWKQQGKALSLPLNITFVKGRATDVTQWMVGKTWGLRWYLSGKDKGLTLKIKLKVENPQTLPIGPNTVLSDQRAPNPRQPPKGPHPTPAATLAPAGRSYPSTSPPNIFGSG